MDLVIQEVVGMLLADSKAKNKKKQAKKAKVTAAEAVDKFMDKEAEEIASRKQKRAESCKDTNLLLEKTKLEGSSQYYVEDPNQQVMNQQETYHFAVWTPQGQPYAEPTLNSEFLKTGGTFNLCAHFLSVITLLVQSISLLFQGLDLPMYQKY